MSETGRLLSAAAWLDCGGMQLAVNRMPAI